MTENPSSNLQTIEPQEAISTDAPLVTVVATCYNHSRFVVECLEGIRNQTYKNIQLIITDDCSKDDSVKVIKDWIAKNNIECLLIVHKENRGLCKTLNGALAHAKGKYLSMTSTDDVWLRDKVEHQVRIMEKLPESIGVLYSDAFRIDQGGHELSMRFIDSARKFEQPPEGNVFLELVKGNWIPAMTTLIRRSCYDTVGYYDESLPYEDYDMWLRIARHYKFVYSPEISARYRIVSNSLVRSMGEKGVEANFRICLKSLGFDHQSDSFLRERLDELANTLYEIGYSKRNRYLWMNVKYNRSLPILMRYLCSVCGMSYQSFSNLVHLLKRSGHHP